MGMLVILLSVLLGFIPSADAAGVATGLPPRTLSSIHSFLRSPTPDWGTLTTAVSFLRSVDLNDPATLERVRPIVEELRSVAQRQLDSSPRSGTTESELFAASQKLRLLNEPEFRNLLTSEQQRRIGAAFWAYSEHLVEDVRLERWSPSKFTLEEKIKGIARALEASRVVPGELGTPTLRSDPAVAVEIVSADVSKVKSDALICGVQLAGLCHGGINAMIGRVGGDGFHRQVDAAKPLRDGQTLVARGDRKNTGLFQNVVFFADNMRLPLRELVFNSLKAADEAGFQSVSLPAARTGYYYGLLEKTYEELVAETIKGVDAFLKAGRKNVENISIVVHNNPRLLSLFKAVQSTDSEREALRQTRLSGKGFSLSPRAKRVSARRRGTAIVQDLLAPWDLARMLKGRTPQKIGVIEARAAFSRPSVSVLNLPIKMPGTDFRIPAELEQYREFLQKIIDDQVAVNPNWSEFHAYLTVDSGFVKKGSYHRRPGIHIDGVQGSRYMQKLPPENTYSASDAVGTVFYAQPFDLRHIQADRDYIHGELERQADERNAVQTANYGIYHWDSYSAHRAAVAEQDIARTFARVEFSKKVYDSVGDTVNPLFDYSWPRLPRPIPYELNWHAEKLARVVQEKGRRANSVSIAFVSGTTASKRRALLDLVRVRRAADVGPLVRILSQDPAVARILVSDKIAPLWDLVTDYPILDGRTAFPELGRPIDDRTIVEGSKGSGGGQTDFLIDYSDLDLRRGVLEPARAIGAKKADDWAKFQKLQALVHRALPRDGWREGGNDPEYAAFLARTKGAARVSLGEYIRLGIGVCRENALLTVVALRAAGYKARYAYFKAFKADGSFDQDHAVAIVELGGTTYVLDSYRLLGRYYNGHRLADLLQPPANGKYVEAGPLAAENASDPGGWKLVLNTFPRVRPLLEDR